MTTAPSLMREKVNAESLTDLKRWTDVLGQQEAAIVPTAQLLAPTSATFPFLLLSWLSLSHRG